MSKVRVFNDAGFLGIAEVRKIKDGLVYTNWPDPIPIDNVEHIVEPEYEPAPDTLDDT